MCTSLLHHTFGIRGYEYVRTEYQGGQVIFTINQDLKTCRGTSRVPVSLHVAVSLHKSELSEEVNRVPGPLGDDTIYMNLRSVLQISTFLSKGVCVPEEHERSGVAPVTPGPDGAPFDWTRITAGNFFVHAQKHRPHDAEVAVHYRGYWFYIAPNDVNSRAVLAILEILFGLQESDARTVGPLLTLPVRG